MLGFSPLADNSIAGFGNAPSDVTVTGVSGTGAVGTVTLTCFSNISVTGIAATSAVGSVTIDAKANVSVTGVAATSAVGSVVVWGPIIPNQTPSYSVITPSQSSTFSAITPSQTPSWGEIAAQLLRSRNRGIVYLNLQLRSHHGYIHQRQRN